MKAEYFIDKSSYAQSYPHYPHLFFGFFPEDIVIKKNRCFVHIIENAPPKEKGGKTIDTKYSGCAKKYT